mgnify:CR=1 FL=1
MPLQILRQGLAVPWPRQTHGTRGLAQDPFEGLQLRGAEARGSARTGFVHQARKPPLLESRHPVRNRSGGIAEHLGHLVSAHSLALDMLAVLSRRLREFAATIENLSLRGVPERLSAYLLHLSDLAGGAGEFELDIKKGLIANLLGTTGESLSRVLGKMTQAGMIRVGGKKITILDREALADVAAARQALD